MRLTHTFATHVGCRENNEDSYLAIPGLYAVADGLGGHAAGEIASRIATDHVREWADSIARFGSRKVLEQIIRTCYNACNHKLLDHMRDHPETRGMGTTLTTLAINDSDAVIGHVGDSRCYLVRAGRCKQITRDHNAPGYAPASFSAEEKQGHWPLFNCFGSRPGTYRGADVFSWPISTGDVFVLATDGLDLTTHEIGAVVELCVKSGANIAGALVQHMLRKGADDNVTVVAVERVL